MLSIELFCGLVGVGMEDKFLQKYSIDLFLAVGWFILVVYAYDGRFISDAKSYLIVCLPRYTIPPSLMLIKFKSNL